MIGENPMRAENMPLPARLKLDRQERAGSDIDPVLVAVAEAAALEIEAVKDIPAREVEQG
jgi:hypothetical protein